jgi:antirestriction protein ArdC
MAADESERRDPAAEITKLIVDRLKAGVLPWSRPWNAPAGGRPLRHEGTPYTGINTLYLWAIGDARGYRSRYWMTYRQAAELGGQVRQGETGSLSVYFSNFRKAQADPRTGEEKEKSIRFLRHYVVFNADQVDGLPAYFHPSAIAAVPAALSKRQDAIDAFFGAIPAEVRHGGGQAFFSPTFDYVQLPEPAAFQSMDHYASTRAHETVHWTGAQKRLSRQFGKRFGDKAYAFEELVASIGQALVCAELGLPDSLHDSHASYIDHWLRILRADKSAIIHAAAKAEQAVTFLKQFGNAVETGRRAAEPIPPPEMLAA